MSSRGGALALLLWLVPLVACLDDPAVHCADGTLCPDGTTCRAVVGTTHCVTPGQLAACSGGGDGASCPLEGGGTGVCNQGVCLRPGCGDGFLSPGEKCDGTLLGGESCATRDFYDGALGCTSECAFDTTGCSGTCGDGLVNGDEQCDGAALAGADCTAGGYYGAAGLGCSSTCRFDFSACSGGRCGDGVVNGSELCDPDAALPADHDRCDDAAFGFYDAGPITCNLLCQYDTSACTGGRCGDDAINGDEDCDGGADPGTSCMGLGYYGGNLNCTPTCFFDLDECAAAGRCGDGVVREGPEECDPGLPGGDPAFAGLSCATPWLFPDGEGRYNGALACNPDCTIDAGACSAYCGDGVISGPEPCDAGPLGMPDDTEDDRFVGNATCRSFGYQFGALMCTNSCNLIDLAGCSGRCGDGVLQGDEACDGATHAVQESSCSAIGEHGAMACDSYCQLDTDACEASTWGATNITVAGVEVIDAMWTAGPRDVWALGGPRATSTRTVIHGDGVAWAPVASPVPTPTALGGAGAVVWLGGSNGAVFQWTGAGWTARGTPATGAVSRIVGDAIRLFVAIGGQLWRSIGTATWAVEPTPAFTSIAAARVLPSGGVLVLGAVGTAWVLAERSPAGAWTSSTIPGAATDRYVALWATSTDLVWAVGGTSATIGSGSNLVAQRARGVWSVTPMKETSPSGFGDVRGTIVGIGGEPDNLWLAGVETDRPWLANYAGATNYAVTRATGPYPRFVGLADSGRGELWAFGDGALVAHRDGPGWVAPFIPGTTTDSTSLRGRIEQASASSLAVTDTDVWLATLPPMGAPSPTFLFQHRAEQPLGQATEARWLTPLSTQPSQRVVARTATDVWSFAPGAGVAHRYTGTAWAMTSVPFAVGGVRATFSVGGSIYVTVPGALWRHDGTAWSSIAAWPGGSDGTALAGSGPTDLWVAGGSGTIDRWNGTAWTSYPQPSGTTGTVRGLWASSPDDVWALGAELTGSRSTAVLLHKGPLDTTFVRAGGSPVFPGELFAIWGSGPADVWAVGDGGFIIHFDGLRWVPVAPVSPSSQELLTAIHGSSRDHVWTAGMTGALFRLDAALPPHAAPPCDDAIPLYCSGVGRPLYGTLPVGGRARYRLDPPFESLLDLSLSTTSGSTATLSAAVRPADSNGTCDLVSTPFSLAVVGNALSVADHLITGHEPIYLELTATGATGPLGYQLDVNCTPTGM